MVKKILVAYEPGYQSQKALEAAIQLAKAEAAEIQIVGTVKMPEYILDNCDITTLHNLNKCARTYYEKELNCAADRAKREGIPVQTRIIHDSLGESVVQLAEREGIDCISISGVSDYVKQCAICQVLVS